MIGKKGGYHDEKVRVCAFCTADLALLVSAQAEVDLSSMRFTVKGVEYMVAALQDEPVEPRENQLDGLPGHAILFGYMGGSDAEESNLALYDGVRLAAPDGKEYRTYSNAGNMENPYTLYFGLPEGMNLGDCTLKCPRTAASSGSRWGSQRDLRNRKGRPCFPRRNRNPRRNPNRNPRSQQSPRRPASTTTM